VLLDATTPVMALIADSVSLMLSIASSKYPKESGKQADFSLQPIAVQGVPALYWPTCYKLRCYLGSVARWLK
jgi:hypothetical protein